MMEYWWLFIALGVMWALQMVLAHRQAKGFMSAVAQLRALGTTAIGVSSTKRIQRRTYVALVADADAKVVKALELSGTTVWAKPKPVRDYEGWALVALAAEPDESQAGKAAAMAARTLIEGQEKSRASAPETDGGSKEDT